MLVFSSHLGAAVYLIWAGSIYSTFGGMSTVYLLFAGEYPERLLTLANWLALLEPSGKGRHESKALAPVLRDAGSWRHFDATWSSLTPMLVRYVWDRFCCCPVF
jgi:hypothetical protein